MCDLIAYELDKWRMKKIIEEEELEGEQPELEKGEEQSLTVTQ